MSGTLQKVMPLVVVAAVFGWCCWPHLFAGNSVDHGGKGGELVAIAQSLLSPAPNSAHDRNPFLTADQLAEKLLTSAQADVKKAAAPTAGSASAEATFAPLALRATLVQGERRLATIGNQVYRLGEPIDSSAPSDKAWIVADILPESVILRRGNETQTLTFSNAGDARPDADSPANDKEPAETPTSSDSRSADLTETVSPGITSVKDLLRLLQSPEATGESP
ncbi:MAG: hypothetical protein GX621_04990 [Pirellulaceae bacterium]|nr:hypothetical protein [Pirellulaceae bacterium]